MNIQSIKFFNFFLDIRKLLFKKKNVINKDNNKHEIFKLF